MSSTENRTKELQSDLNELSSLLNQANRINNRLFLNAQIDHLKEEVARLQKSEQDRLARLSSNPAPVTGYIKKIDTYGWDQSEKFVKIYVTGLKDLDKLKEGDVTCQYTDRSFDLVVRHINNVSHQLVVNNLLNSIEAGQSYFKLKSDMVTVFLKKVEQGRNWAYVTEKEAKIKAKTDNKPMPKMDENADPQEGLMSLMKKMYDEGDDEMKRTISKAFTESREKKGEMGSGDELGGMGGLGGMRGGKGGMDMASMMSGMGMGGGGDI